jgi:hypothetical protein
MEELRREISQLPSPEREWTVLWLGTLPNPNNVVRPYTEDEQVRNATELGHDAMLQLLGGQIQSTDPDLRSRQDPVYSESLQALQTFVLKHSPLLLVQIVIFFFKRNSAALCGITSEPPDSTAKPQPAYSTLPMIVLTGSGTVSIEPYSSWNSGICRGSGKQVLSLIGFTIRPRVQDFLAIHGIVY